MRHKIFLILLIPVIAGCKKMVEVDPPITSPVSTTVYTSDAKAAQVLTSIYSKMGSQSVGFAQGTSGLSLIAGLSADEFETYPSIAGLTNLYINSPLVFVTKQWTELYQLLYIANAALEGLSGSTGLTEPVKNQLTGEAKFMRAFLHFYLVNFWGDVPLMTATDYRVNSVAARTQKADVYQLIINDLKEAKTLLTDDYVTPVGVSTTERVRPNKGAAAALLARVYLYTSNWEGAESEASQVISNTAKYSLVSPLTSVFLKNSMETIWQLQPVVTGYNTYDGNAFIRTLAPTGVEPVSLRPAFRNNFETGDQRKLKWIDSVTINTVKYYYPSKYKVKGGPATTPVTEYLMVLRLAEQFLIRAEARANQNNISGAQADLNVVRSRAGLPVTTATDKNSLLAAILRERQVELFTEWGHRWLDLKRTGTVDAVMNVVTPLKGGTWNSNWQLYPIPQTEIALDPNLTQNSGYN